MEKHLDRWKVSALLICFFFLLCGIGMLSGKSFATPEKKKIEHKRAYELYTKKCLSCHDSVADPEKPGRTRDDWFLVVNVMHGYGFDLTDDDAAMIVDLLYELRPGIEKEAG
jgi:hypothetical protein